MHPLNRPSTHRASVLAAWTLGILALTPLIVVAGLFALITVTAVSLGRRTRVDLPVRPRAATARPILLHLEAASADSSMGAVAHRAA